MTTIYLSSTYEDLKDYRRVVIDALRKSNYDVRTMEDYVAGDQRPVDKCLDDVSNSDIYIGLFGFRYGYVPQDQTYNANGLSITELEFRKAESLKKPCLTFIAKEEAGISLKMVDAVTGEGARGEKINALRQYLLAQKLTSSFSNPHELATLVLAAVKTQLDRIKKLESPIAKASAPAIIWDIKKEGSPYPGLMHFTRKYARVFFGREQEIGEILDRMRQPEGRFIIISGDSGVGKSSVVDAGILPKLEDGALPDIDRCVTVRMVPGQSGEPFDAFKTAMGSLVTRAGLQPDAIVRELKQSPDTLTRLLSKIIAGGSDGKTLVLFLDQMEELFTAQDVEQSSKFLTALYLAAQEKALWVIATIRSDHLQFCHRHPDMLQVLRGQGHYPLGRVEQFMMHDMIVKPANCAGLKVSGNLGRHIVNDTGSESGNLPLLAFVLNQLFEKRSDHELSEKVYKDLGGVSGAIAEHVKTVEAKTRQDLGRKTGELLPEIFQSLVIVNPEGLPTRRRPLLSGFSEAQRPVVKLLTDERLLQTEGEGGNATVSISHEKLFETWPALRDYIAANKKLLMDQTLLESRARKWEEMGKPRLNGLASGRELKDFRRAGFPTRQAKEYLRASRRAVWLRNGTGVVLASIFLVIAWGWREGLSVEQTMLKLLSTFSRIDKEPEIVEIKADSFRMGTKTNDAGYEGEQPVREVQIKPFKLGRYEVTFSEYDRFALDTNGRLPSDWGWGRGQQPVIDVTWQDAVNYAKWLSAQTGKRYRLPTEAEWEFAARSGGKEEIWAGTSSEPDLDYYGWHMSNSKNQAQPVGNKKPNGLGLHDMSGNVFEWIEDCWHANYNGAPLNALAWKEESGGDCRLHVMRGGSYYNEVWNVRSSVRFWSRSDNRNNYIGFRLAQDID